MKQNLIINTHVFNFKQLDSYYDATFKLRISLHSGHIPEKKMIKGTQPLAGYSPKDFYISDTISPLSFEFQNPNIYYSMGIDRSFDPFHNPKSEGDNQPHNDPVIVIELLMYGLSVTSFAKKFPPDDKGFSNIGHNILRVKDLNKNSHEITKVIFDEVLFCSVDLVVHCHTLGFSFYDDLNSSSGDGNPIHISNTH